MRKIGEMRIWWLWRKFVEMARVLQKTIETRDARRGETSSLGQTAEQTATPQVIEGLDIPAGNPRQEREYNINATHRRSGGAAATSYIASVSEILQRSIGNS